MRSHCGGAAGLTLSCIASSNVQRVRQALPGMDVVASSGALFANPDIDLVVIATPNNTFCVTS
jgi:predicted dehydrogenase